jgi:circadian clock protein KaiB
MSQNGVFRFRLFVTGSTHRSDMAIANLHRICAEQLGGNCEVDVIDVLRQPELAESMKVLATPTVIKESPPPRRRVTGDLSDASKVLQLLMIPGGTTA